VRISDALRGGRPTISFEFFPPKNDAAADELIATAAAMRALQPAFVSITYGAGGSSRARSLDLIRRIKSELALEVMAHVTCAGSTAGELRSFAGELAAAGVRNVLALRGDPPRDVPADFGTRPGGLAHACELTALLADGYDFCIGGACYPETHTEAPDAETDLRHLVTKVNAGASFLITQLFFENERYFAFVARARAAGITVPIVPGIMPITNYEQVRRFTTMCGASIPARLRAELERCASDPAAIVDLGVAFAAQQCADLLARGAPGLHFYTLNKSPAVRAVVSALRAEAVLAAA
jgi:methylenetetrahydrofolate reductase (NADPH)